MRVPGGKRGVTWWPVLVAVVAAFLLAACTGAPPQAGTDTGTGTARAEAPGPPEITAGAQDRLPGGRPGTGTPSIVIGTKDFSEQFLLGELYSQALRAKGYTVTLQQNVGASEVIDTAFATNQIQMYPEYLGEIATGLAPKLVANTPLGVYQTAAQFERSQRAAAVLKQTPYQNIDVLVTKRVFAQQHGLRSVADLANVGRVRLAAQPSFRTRANGLEGLAQQYGLSDVEFLAVTPDVAYEALDGGQVDVADAFSTDAQLRSGDYTELDDPQNVLGFQYVAPVVKQASLDRLGPGFSQTCNWVSAQLTVDAIRTMNAQVQSDGASEADVARQFLASKGLR